jgi:hypothetical protein
VDETAQHSAEDTENIAHSSRLCREDQTAQRSGAAIKKSIQVLWAAPDAAPVPEHAAVSAPAPPIGSHVTRSQGIVSPEALMAFTTDPFNYMEHMVNPWRDHWKCAMEEERRLILLNNTVSILNSLPARQLQVIPTGSKWVHKTKFNHDGSTGYKGQLVLKGKERTHFGEIYAPVGKVTKMRYLTSPIRSDWSNLAHLDVVTDFLLTKIDDGNIYLTMPETWPEELKPPKIAVRLRKVLYSLKRAPWRLPNAINFFLLSLGFTQSLADPNLYLRSDGIMILLYIDDLSMWNHEAAAKAAIEVKAKLSGKHQNMNIGLAHKFLSIEIYRNGTVVSFEGKAYIVRFLWQCGMEHIQDVSLPVDPNFKFDLPDDMGQKELDHVTDDQAVVESPMYTVLVTRADISNAVAALSHYNLRRFTSHMTAAKRFF